MPNTREKLIELLADSEYMSFEKQADYLIDSGVEIPVRCKDCVYRHSSEFCECRPADGFCNDGERSATE